MHRTTPRVFYLSAMALACAVTTTPASADTLLKTDATWKVTPTAPTGSWNSAAGFDTSSWQAANVLYNVSAYPGYESYTAQGIWSSGGQFSTTETAVWARRVWHLDSLPISASLLAGFDDDADLWINGTQIISNHDGVAGNVISVADLLPYLTLGDNLVAYAATDNYPVWGYNHSSWVQIDGRIAAVVPEPGTYALMLAGLAAVGFTSRSRSRSGTR